MHFRLNTQVLIQKLLLPDICSAVLFVKKTVNSREFLLEKGFIISNKAFENSS